MTRYHQYVAYALQRARIYVALDDMFMARMMTQSAESNMNRIRQAETQMTRPPVRRTHRTAIVSIPLNV